MTLPPHGAPAAATHVLRRGVPVDHPSFAGHFPGGPILPGVLLLAEVMEALRGLGDDIALAGCEVASAKFLSPVAPGDELTITLQVSTTGWRFDVHVGAVRAATGSLVRTPA
jgi:3-hydroxymyristoyl/3-hydroxydecanoyl-(acyl carrier protein) dehydratase